MSTEIAKREPSIHAPATVDPNPAAAIALAANPQDTLARAEHTAKVLMGAVTKGGMVQRIQGRDHVKIEGWTLLASLVGVTPIVEWTRRLDEDGLHGWEAAVEVFDAGGRRIGRGEAMALKDEGAPWGNKEFSCRAMAQTRATARALRNCLGFIVALAGYAATSAEEMPDERAQQAAPATRSRRQAARDRQPDRAAMQAELDQRGRALAEIVGGDMKRVDQVLSALGKKWADVLEDGTYAQVASELRALAGEQSEPGPGADEVVVPAEPVTQTSLDPDDHEPGEQAGPLPGQESLGVGA